MLETYFDHFLFKNIVIFAISFTICNVLFPFFINRLLNMKYKQQIRDCYTIHHKKKKQTPTSGGAIILLASILSIFIFEEVENKYIYITILALISFSFVGIFDDVMKFKKKNTQGLTTSNKFKMQSISSFIVCVTIYFNCNKYGDVYLYIPFLQYDIHICKLYYTILIYFVIVGSSNGANFTDGLDGLMILPSIFIFVYIIIVSIINSSIFLSDYFHLYYMPDIYKLNVICSAIVGASLSFLLFNSHPASIFLGDIGSLSIGALIGVAHILIKQEIILLFIGGIFVIETLSIIIQVSYFKLSKEKMFKMAPIHHHYEMNNIKENKIVIAFWVAGTILIITGFISII